MKLSILLPAPPGGAVGVALPDVLAALPGCRSVSPADDGSLRFVVDVAIAAVRGLWAGTLTETAPGEWRLTGAGEPGRADLAIRLADDRATLEIEGTVDGPLATIGAALLAAAIRRLAEQVLAGAAP